MTDYDFQFSGVSFLDEEDTMKFQDTFFQYLAEMPLEEGYFYCTFENKMREADPDMDLRELASSYFVALFHVARVLHKHGSYIHKDDRRGSFFLQRIPNGVILEGPHGPQTAPEFRVNYRYILFLKVRREEKLFLE